MNRDQVVDYIAGLTDSEIGALIADAGDRARRAPEQSTAGELLEGLEEIRAAIGQIDAQIQAAIASGDFQTSIALKQQRQLPLRRAELKAQQALNKRLDEGN